MFEQHRFRFNEIIARREAERRLRAQQRRDAVMAMLIATTMGGALAVLATLCVALISSPR